MKEWELVGGYAEITLLNKVIYLFFVKKRIELVPMYNAIRRSLERLAKKKSFFRYMSSYTARG